MSETPETSASAQASQAAAKGNTAQQATQAVSQKGSPTSGTSSTSGNATQSTPRESSTNQTPPGQDTRSTGNDTNAVGQAVRAEKQGARDVADKATGQSSVAEIQRDAARLLQADVKRNQARTTALATGFDSHHDEAEDAQAEYEEVRASVDNEAVAYAYQALLNPRGMGGQSRQVDTSGTAGHTLSGSILHAADIFGHPVQRAVAQTATVTAPDPVTVIGGIPHSDLVEPESLRKAQSGSSDRSGRHERNGSDRNSDSNRSSDNSNRSSDSNRGNAQSGGNSNTGKNASN